MGALMPPLSSPTQSFVHGGKPTVPNNASSTNRSAASASKENNRHSPFVPSFSATNVNSSHGKPPPPMPSFSPFNNKNNFNSKSSSTTFPAHVSSPVHSNKNGGGGGGGGKAANSTPPVQVKAGKWSTAHVKIAHMIMSHQHQKHMNMQQQQQRGAVTPSMPIPSGHGMNSTNPYVSSSFNKSKQTGLHFNDFPIQPAFHNTNNNGNNSVKTSTTASASTFYPPIQSPLNSHSQSSPSSTPYGGLASLHPSQTMLNSKSNGKTQYNEDAKYLGHKTSSSQSHNVSSHKSSKKSHHHSSHHHVDSSKSAGKSHQLNTSGDKHRSRSRSPLTSQRGTGKDTTKDSLMQSNFLATEAAITALAEQHLKMFRQPMATPNKMPLMSPFSSMPGMPQLPGLPGMGMSAAASHYPLNLPPLGGSATQAPLILPPPPPPQHATAAAYSPMLSPKSLQNKFMQSMTSQMPANVSESDFFRMLAAMPNMSGVTNANGQPGMPPPLSRSPSINKTSATPQPPNPADMFNNNFFLQHFFENFNATNRTAPPPLPSVYADETNRSHTRPVDEEKSVSLRKDLKQINDDELGGYERKAKKPKFSYSAESLLSDETPGKRGDEIIKPLDEKHDENNRLVEEAAPVETQAATTSHEPEPDETANPGHDAVHTNNVTESRDEEAVDDVNRICNDNAEQTNDQDKPIEEESCCDLSQTTEEKLEKPPKEEEDEEEVTTS